MKNLFIALSALTLWVISLSTETQAQQFTDPTGCQTTTLKNTLLFEQSRAANPNDTSVVLGAFTVTDDDVSTDNINHTENCHTPGPADNYPTHVTVLTVTLAGGDLTAADLLRVRLVSDANGDGFFQPEQDKQIGSELAGSCLFSSCVFSLGRVQALFTVLPGTPRSVLVVADAGPKLSATANLKISMKAEANDIASYTLSHVSSDFNEAYRTQISNLTLNPGQGECGSACAPDHRGNGSGSYESSFKILRTQGLPTRFRETEIKAGTREVIAAVLYVCEGGVTMTDAAKIQPAFTDVGPQIKDYPNSLACRNSSSPDAFGTRLLRVLVKVSGNVNAVGKMYLYDDANDNGALFEQGEMAWRTNLDETNTAVFGTLSQSLLGETRSHAWPSAGHYAPQTNPPKECTPNVPQGASVGCPHVLIITFDVKPTAEPGNVTFDINLEVGNLPNEAVNAPTASSNLVTGSSQQTSLVIGGEEPKGNLRLIKKVAEHSGDPLKVEDGDMLYALRQWTLGAPIDGMTLTDEDILTLLDWWKRETRLAGFYRTLAVQLQSIKNEKIFIVSDLNPTHTEITVYDLKGRIVFKDTASGNRVLFQNADQLPNGVYLWSARMQTTDGHVLQTQMQKLVLLR